MAALSHRKPASAGNPLTVAALTVIKRTLSFISSRVQFLVDSVCVCVRAREHVCVCFIHESTSLMAVILRREQKDGSNKSE